MSSWDDKSGAIVGNTSVQQDIMFYGSVNNSPVAA